MPSRLFSREPLNPKPETLNLNPDNGILAASSGVETEATKEGVQTLSKVISGAIAARGIPPDPLKHQVDAIIKALKKDGGFTQFGAKPPLFVSLEPRRPGTESEVGAETSRKLRALVDVIFGTLAGNAVLDPLMEGIDFGKHTLHEESVSRESLLRTRSRSRDF